MKGADIIVIDQLYGAITIPAWLHPVVFSPELQRLREVRLINTTSPSCSALSDARRFTHTLGVLHLASRLHLKISRHWPKEQSRAFLVAALLHDIGTPAFGHLFEYQLAAIKGWNHEKFVSELIRGTYRRDKRRHQIYYNNSLRLHEIFKDIGIDIDIVADLINGRTELGKLLSGFVDLDNIDNVFRMAALLGLTPDPTAPVRLVESITPDPQGIVFEEAALPLLQSWVELRRRTYEILAFDEQCLSGQAMLTDCLTTALTNNYLDESHWFFTDEQLLHELLNFSETKEVIQRFAVGNFYHPVYLGWYACPKGQLDLRHPDNRSKLVERVKQMTGISCSPYVFYDSGTFSKKLNLTTRGTNAELKSVDFGHKSESTIVSVFTARQVNGSKRKMLNDCMVEILAEFGLRNSDLKPIPDRQSIYEIPSQRLIPFRA